MKIVVIDDEPHCRNVIKQLVSRYFPDFQLVAFCEDGLSGLLAISKHKPDLVFLDIEMPKMNGFQMLEALGSEEIPFTLIFTTAYDKFAIKAFKYSAFEYLLKPIDDDDLVATLLKVQKKPTPARQLQYLKQNIESKSSFNKLTIATSRGISFIELDDIIALEADGNYTKFYIKGQDPILTSKTLGTYDELLTERNEFFRSHKQYIINLNYLKEYLGVTNEIILKNGMSTKLARTRKDEFMNLIKVK